MAISIDTHNLVRVGVLTAEDLERHTAAALSQDPPMNTAMYLMRHDIVTEEHMFMAYAVQIGRLYIAEGNLNPKKDALSAIPHELARQLRVVPVEWTEDKRLLLAVQDPTPALKNALEAQLNYDLDYLIASRTTIDNKIEQYYSAAHEAAATRIHTALEDAGPSLDEQLLAGGGDQAVAKTVKLLIMEGLARKASDIHIEPVGQQYRVRYRIDGELIVNGSVNYTPAVADLIISRIKIMANLDPVERRRPLDGRISFNHEGRKVDLRVASLPVKTPIKDSQKIVMRILSNDLAGKPLKELNFTSHNLKEMRDALSKPHGIVLVTGPTGSGKSTTLYSGISEVARDDVNVMTAEDPVEYQVPGINQVQVSEKPKVTFADALRAFLRADPDIILIGEIRDHETAEIAIKAALTGHLVLSTLHTNSAALTVSRLIEMGVAPYLVADALTAVLSQRLVRRLCAHCRVEHVPSAHDVAALVGHLDGEVPQVWRANTENPCERGGCRRGYAGRVPLHELMPITPEIKAAIAASAAASELERMSIASGRMKTLLQDGWEKVKAGLTDMDQVLALQAAGADD